MEKKLIQDGSENKRAQMYRTSNWAGLAFCLLGLAAILLKGFTVEYVDETGFLHENFFLLPLGLGLLGVGFCIVLSGLFYYWKKTGDMLYIINTASCLGMVFFAVLTLLIYSNGDRLEEITVIGLAISIAVRVVSGVKARKMSC